MTNFSTKPHKLLVSSQSSKTSFTCLCGKARADYVLRPNGRDYWIGCHVCKAHGLDGGDYLRELAAFVGAPSGAHLISAAPRWLGHLATGPSVGNCRSREPVPSYASVAGWRERLLSDPVARAYVTDERGLTERTIRRWWLGYDGKAIVLPTRRRGRVVNARRRYLDPGAHPKMRGLQGRRARLYPALPRGDAWVLCEGEFDALVTLQHGLPAVTSTAGTHWSSAWDKYLPGRRVAVVYDAGPGSLAAADQRAAALRAAGAEDAWAVSLGSAGLREGEDLTDWFVTYGRDADALLDLILREREAGR